MPNKILNKVQVLEITARLNKILESYSEFDSIQTDIESLVEISAHMSIDRFIMINKCLHFNNNDDMSALDLDSEAILLHLNKKFQKMYTPGQNLADLNLDESLLVWKCWLEICQLILNKAANKGKKTYEFVKENVQKCGTKHYLSAFLTYLY